MPSRVNSRSETPDEVASELKYIGSLPFGMPGGAPDGHLCEMNRPAARGEHPAGYSGNGSHLLRPVRGHGDATRHGATRAGVGNRKDLAAGLTHRLAQDCDLDVACPGGEVCRPLRLVHSRGVSAAVPWRATRR